MLGRSERNKEEKISQNNEKEEDTIAQQKELLKEKGQKKYTKIIANV